MKKLFTILSVAVCAGLSAQNLSAGELRNAINSKKETTRPMAKKVGSSSRSTTVPFALDYATTEAFVADQESATFGVYLWDVNNRHANTNSLSLRYYTVLFDTLLINLGDGAGNVVGTTFIPKQSATLTLDSFDVWAQHEHTTSGTDTVKITVYNTASLGLSGSGANGNLTQTSLWDTTLYLTSALPVTTGSWSVLSFHPNLSLAQGETFGIRVDYTGDTANHFSTGAGYRENCGDQAGALPSPARDNSLYYINFTQGASNLSGVNSIGIPGSPCPELWIQDLFIFPYVTADVEYGAAVVSEKSVACAGDVINLEANVFGTSATSASFQWTASSGTLATASATDDPTNSITLGSGPSTIYLAVTADGITTYDTTTINVHSIGVTFNTNPVNLSCVAGSTVVLAPTYSGNAPTSGRTYSWSNGPTSQRDTVAAPGAYTVTVTNSSGCTASATVNVQYPGGVTNTANYTKPTNGTSYLCTGVEYTFVNTSDETSNGWTSEWNFGDGTPVIDDQVDGKHTYTTAGNNIVVKLTMKNADGCSFSKTQTVNVKDCTGINDPSFDKSISMSPNPTNANVTIEAEGIEKTVSVSMFNILGEKVKSFSADANGTFSKTFNVSDLASGTYIVKVASGSKIATKRLVINK